MSALEQAWAAERPSRSQDELITEYVRLDQIVKNAAFERKDIVSQLAGIALEEKGEQNTVHLTSTGGQSVKVEFGVDYSYDTQLMMDVAKLLGSERFDQLFKTKIEFVAFRRELKKFLNTVAADEATKTAKQIIKDATVEKVRSPSVTVEKK